MNCGSRIAYLAESERLWEEAPKNQSCFAANPKGGYNIGKRFGMGNQYVEQRDGGYYVSGTRVSLDSVVYAFLRGESPEGIVESFPALSLEQAYGAIAFYLAHQQTVDAYLQKGRADFERMREEARREHPALYAKLEAARRSMPSSRA